MRTLNTPVATTAPPTSAPHAPVATAAPGTGHAPDVRRQELAAFLRSRRERITPEQVGLPDTGRRRTPGLRREEVAQLASVGVTWYTWLEQGRDIQVSGQVLTAVARALLLDPNERAHLYTLAGAALPEAGVDCPSVTPSVRRVLDQLAPLPACVMNSRYDLLAWNATYAELLGDIDALPFEERNIVWLLFTNEDFRGRFLDPEAARLGVVARLRAALAEHVGDPAWKALLARLRQASPEFEAIWQRHEVGSLGNGIKGFVHPEAGTMRMEYTSMWLGRRLGTRLVTYTPADEETEERLRGLAAR